MENINFIKRRLPGVIHYIFFFVKNFTGLRIFAAASGDFCYKSGLVFYFPKRRLHGRFIIFSASAGKAATLWLSQLAIGSRRVRVIMNEINPQGKLIFLKNNSETGV